MTESVHGYVLAELEAAKGGWPEIAGATHISLRTIQKIASGEIADPGVTKIEKLAAYFRRNSRKPVSQALRA